MRLIKGLRKFVSVIATAAVIFNSLAPSMAALAQEGTFTPDPTPTPQEETTPAPEATIAPTETPTESPTPTDEASPTPETVVEPTPQVDETTPAPESQPEVQEQTNESAQSQAPPAESPTVSPSTEPTIAPIQPEEDGSLTAEILDTNLFSETLQENPWFQVITDKLDYTPTESAVITGAGFTPGETYSLTVSSADEPATSTTVEITADPSGSFTYIYQLDGIYRPNYLVEVKIGEVLLASTTFTDTNWQSVNDTQGVNDEPGQKDLTKLSRDLDSINPVLIKWNWDETSMSGSNTADACALFDTDNDGLANYALCAVWEDNQQQLSNSPRLYSCNDSRPDRCSGDVLVSISNGSTCSITNSGDDPFPEGDEYPNDTQASCSINLADVGGASSAYLIDVCSYPSTQPNSDPSDCVIIQDNKAFLTIIKDVSPNNASTNWDFAISGATNTNTSIAGDGSSGIIQVEQGTYSITETAGTNTNISEYSTTWSCVKNGSVTPFASGSGTSATNISIGKVQNVPDSVTCTFTNSIQNGTLTVQKTTLPAADPTIFTINATGSGTITGGGAGSISDSADHVYTATAGTYSVAETVPSGWSKTGDTCQNVTVTAGQNTNCLITNTKLGKIIVEKQTLPNGSGQSFSFIPDYGQGFSLTDGQTNDSGFTLAPNTYSVSETVPPGWDQTSATCTDGSPVSAIELAAGETVTCTFTNTQRGHIIVNKTTVGGNGSFDFTTSGTGYSGFSLSNGGSNDQVVLPGSYTVSETGVTGWSSDEGSCDMGETPGNLDVGAGETVTCTFTNTKLPILTVVKNLVPSDDPGQFNLRIDETTYAANVGDEGSTGPQILSIGTYLVDETADTSTDLSDYNTSYSEDCLNGSVDLEAGDDITCTITNTRKTGNVIIDKIVSGGSALESDWIFTIFNVLGEYEDDDEITLNTGTYTISESDNVPGYTLTAVGGICDNQDGLSATLTVTEDGGTCSFTNTRDTGNLVITKLIDADGDLETDDDQTPFEGWVMDIDPDGQDTDDPSIPATDSSGESGANGIKTGEYWVTEDPNGPTDNYHFLDSYCTLNDVPTGDSGTGSFGEVEVAKDQTTYCTFVNARDTGTIVVHKIIDVDGDPLTTDDQTDGEGWEMGVDGYGDATDFFTQFTLADGSATFAPANTGTYNVREVQDQQEGYDLVDGYCDNGIFDAQNGIVLMTLGADDTVDCTFINSPNSSIHGRKWDDLDANGEMNELDELLSGWTIKLYQVYGEGSSLLDSFVTSAGAEHFGWYWFDHLFPGDYMVCEEPQGGWDQTYPTEDDGCHLITLPDGNSGQFPVLENATYGPAYDFGNYQPASIGDFIWQDNNGDGLQDVGEPGIAGVQANLYLDDGDGVFEPGADDVYIGTDTTGGAGTYLFENLIPGDYWVDVVDATVPAGYFTTTPDPSFVLDLDPAENYQLADFGYVPPQPEISITKTNNSGSGISAGANVTYTLTITNNGNVDFSDVLITDFLPGGFTYVDGSVTGATFVSFVGSKLSLRLDSLEDKETAIITYQAQTNSSLADGDYLNFATCLATYDEQSTLACDQVNSTVRIGHGVSYGGNLLGQVLGISTELPATGSPTTLLIVSLAALGAGLLLNGLEKKNKKKAVRKTAGRKGKRKHAKK
ncbi:MAG TPA: SdrD B-like domain-containing protein [Patescibacteria group bacterium]|nr:SdrD B-like domain-containing protein [Patescibacteria group bacterium]